MTCGTPFGEREHYIELEWPPESDADPGKLSGYQCGECANAVATPLLIDRADALDLEPLFAGLWPEDVDAPTPPDDSAPRQTPPGPGQTEELG